MLIDGKILIEKKLIANEIVNQNCWKNKKNKNKISLYASNRHL